MTSTELKIALNLALERLRRLRRIADACIYQKSDEARIALHGIIDLTGLPIIIYEERLQHLLTDIERQESDRSEMAHSTIRFHVARPMAPFVTIKKSP